MAVFVVLEVVDYILFVDVDLEVPEFGDLLAEHVIFAVNKRESVREAFAFEMALKSTFLLTLLLSINIFILVFESSGDFMQKLSIFRVYSIYLLHFCLPALINDGLELLSKFLGIILLSKFVVDYHNKLLPRFVLKSMY